MSTADCRSHIFRGQKTTTTHGSAVSVRVSPSGHVFVFRGKRECVADHPISRIHELLPWNLIGILPTYLS